MVYAPRIHFLQLTSSLDNIIVDDKNSNQECMTNAYISVDHIGIDTKGRGTQRTSYASRYSLVNKMALLVCMNARMSWMYCTIMAVARSSTIEAAYITGNFTAIYLL